MFGVSACYLIPTGTALVLSMLCGSTSAVRGCHQEAPLELRNYNGRVIVPENMCNGTIVQDIDLYYKPTVYLHSHKPGSDRNNYTTLLLMENAHSRERESTILWLVTKMKLGNFMRLENGTTLIDYIRPPNVTANFTLIVYNRRNTDGLLRDFEVSKPTYNEAHSFRPVDKLNWERYNMLEELSRITFVNRITPYFERPQPPSTTTYYDPYVHPHAPLPPYPPRKSGAGSQFSSIQILAVSLLAAAARMYT